MLDLINRYNEALHQRRNRETEAGRVGDDGETLQEQSRRGLRSTVDLNGAFVQQSPAGRPGTLNSLCRAKIQTGCKSNSS